MVAFSSVGVVLSNQCSHITSYLTSNARTMVTLPQTRLTLVRDFVNTIGPNLYKNTPYDPLKDLQPILMVAGVDEVGRGPLAGPVIAAAVILDPSRPVQEQDCTRPVENAGANLRCR